MNWSAATLKCALNAGLSQWQWHRSRRRTLRFIQSIQNSSDELLAIRSADVLARIRAGDSSWEQLVPPIIAEIIKRDALFGYRGTQRLAETAQPA